MSKPMFKVNDHVKVKEKYDWDYEEGYIVGIDPNGTYRVKRWDEEYGKPYVRNIDPKYITLITPTKRKFEDGRWYMLKTHYAGHKFIYRQGLNWWLPAIGIVNLKDIEIGRVTDA